MIRKYLQLSFFLAITCQFIDIQAQSWEEWREESNKSFKKWREKANKSWELWQDESQEAWEKWKKGKGKKESKPNSLEVFWVTPKEDVLTVRREFYLVQACIFSKTKIKSIEITQNNNQDKSPERGQSRVKTCEGTPLYKRIKLKEGENMIMLTITNEEGQKNYKKIVHYKTAEPKRIALVIGNSQYKKNPLDNPINDANGITESLKKLGFKVIKYTDLKTKNDFEYAISKYLEKSNGYDAGLIFYAGHGMQLRGENYLIPTQANIQNSNDIANNCYPLSQLLEKSQANTNIVLLDACRNNGFGISSKEGLADVQLNKGSNFFIGYATSPNEVALDGWNKNSVFTEAILQHIYNPVSIFKLYTDVTKKVKNKTRNVQVPWQSSSLSEVFYFIE